MVWSCNNPSKKPEYIIGFSQCIGSDQWRKTMLSEMQRELSFHKDVTLLYEDANGNSKKQVTQVRSLLDKGIDLLIISPNEASPLTPIVEEAYHKGIPVIIIDRKTSSSLYTAYVGADNFEIGRMAGEYIANRLNKRGNVVEVMGLPGSSPAIERQNGFSQALKSYPEIKITMQLHGDWLRNKAQEEIKRNINKFSETDAVFAHNDQMALGTYHSLSKYKLNKNVKIVGVDALPGKGNGLEFVSGKILDASMLYPTGGKEAIITAFAILNKQTFNKNTLLKTVVIDSSNVRLMKLQEERMANQQSDIERRQHMLEDQQKIYKDQQTILNTLVISLVLAIIFAGIAFYSLNENWKSNKRLETQNRKIIEHKEQMLQLSAKAAEASEAKFNFFTNISHEFRTPLTLILVPLEELLADNKIASSVKNHLGLINKNVIRLLRMVNQLIDFRKIEYEKMTLKASQNNLITFIREIASSFEGIAKKRNVDLRIIADKTDLKAWFDVNLFDKVIFNLLSNAFKFTKENGNILITIKENNEQAEIKVEDNGLGMSEEEAAHAFELFYQGEELRPQGSGLGLALSKEIIEAHKGNICVQSKKQKGTIFTINIPLGDSHLSAEEKEFELPKYNVNYENLKIYTTELEEEYKIAGNEESNMGAKEKSLLIIEDNEDMLEFLKQKFSAEYEVFTASDGNSGLREAFEKVPDLIISDVVIPAKSGAEISKVLKSDLRTSHIPIVLLTARGSHEQQIEGMQSMADVYMTKPFNLNLLNETVKNLLYNRSILRTRFSSELPDDSKSPIASKLDKKFINDFASIVEANLSNESFNVEDICKSIGISRVQLYRKVKALLNCNITEYILNRRLQKAKFLLLNEDLSIAEITYKVGFASPTYFATVFKSKYNCTPSDFKKRKT